MMDFLFSHPVALAALALGYVLLVFEFCIPGFGVPGILGTILAVIGIITMQPSPMQALAVVAVYVVLLALALLICLRSAANGRLSKSRLVLNEQVVHPEQAASGNAVGTIGVACTALRPAGIADFEGERLNVVTEGDFIDAGERIKIARMEGNRIVVFRA